MDAKYNLDSSASTTGFHTTFRSHRNFVNYSENDPTSSRGRLPLTATVGVKYKPIPVTSWGKVAMFHLGAPVVAGVSILFGFH